MVLRSLNFIDFSCHKYGKVGVLTGKTSIDYANADFVPFSLKSFWLLRNNCLGSVMRYFTLDFWTTEGCKERSFVEFTRGRKYDSKPNECFTFVMFLQKQKPTHKRCYFQNICKTAPTLSGWKTPQQNNIISTKWFNKYWHHHSNNPSPNMEMQNHTRSLWD